ncbi:MAG: C-terminal binding protein [Acidobacteriota bacterium]
MFKVVCTDAVRFVPSVDREILSEAGAEFVAVQCRNEDDVVAHLRDANGVLASLSPMTRRVMQNAPHLKVIARYGIGVDTVDVGAATDHGIYVTNVPDFCFDEVSDTTMSLILATMRKVVMMHQLIRRRVYDRKLAVPIFKLRGQVLGLVGLGNIARAVVRKAIPFGFRVVAYDPFVKAESLDGLPVELLSLEDLLRQADVVSLHVPLTAETRKMIGEDQLRLMKPSAYLVNTSRGPVVNQPALIRALKEGWIAGAGLDVLEKEPPDPEDPILELDNVVLTPHYASYSEEAYQEVRAKAAQQVVQVMKGLVPTCLVNKEVLNRASLRR